MLPFADIQTAVYGALLPVLSPVPLLDAAGPDQEYPYVTFGEFAADQADCLTAEGVDMDMTIHVWSRQPGMLETQLLMDIVKDTLHGKSFALTGAVQHVTTIWEYATTLRDPDGLTRHGVLRFRVLTFQPV